MADEFKPVRKIKPTWLSLTGATPAKEGQDMAEFESALERDFLRILRFDLNVAAFFVQPMVLEYTDENGKERTYTPDVLVRYRNDITPAKEMPTLLCEVKPREILRKKWCEFKPKFRAAQTHAREEGWRFCILTEREIRTPYLDNAKFLQRYRSMEDDPHIPLVIDTLAILQTTTPADLLSAIYSDRTNQAKLLPVVWNLVSRKWIGADLNVPLTMTSELWSLDLD